MLPRDAEAASAAFRRVYEDPREARLDEPPAWEPWERDLVAGPFARPGRLLDIGCGAGRETLLFSDLGFEVVGIDPSAAMIDAARRAQALSSRPAPQRPQDPRRRGCVFMNADPESVEFDEASFDYVYTTRTLISLFIGRERRLRLLRRLRRWLKPGGLAALYGYPRPADEGLPAALSWRLRRLLSLALGRHPWEAGDAWMPVGAAAMSVFHRFAPGELEEELRLAGFTPRPGSRPGCWLGLA